MTYSLVENGNVIFESPVFWKVSEEFNKRYYSVVNRYLDELPSCRTHTMVLNNCVSATIFDFDDRLNPTRLWTLKLYFPEVLNDK